MDFQTSKDIVDDIQLLMDTKDRDTFIKYLGDLSATLIQTNYPFISDIVEKVRKTSDGEINIAVRVKDGKVNTVVLTEFTKFTYK